MSKIEQLVESEGYESVESFIQNSMNDGTCMGICTNEDCDYTTEVEPDQDSGFCENCDTNTVRSGLVLVGM